MTDLLDVSQMPEPSALAIRNMGNVIIMYTGSLIIYHYWLVAVACKCPSILYYR